MSYSCQQGREADPLPVYKIIGKAFNTTPGVVCFINHMYNTDASHFSIPDSSQVYPLSSHDSTLLNHCRYLTIKISQTLGAGIPVIRRIKVIAFPHSFSYLKPPPRNDESPHKDDLPGSSVKKVTREDNLESDIQRNDNQVINSDDNVPKEFVDPLTCEVMSLPVILPSGYTVDQRTLDRHVEMEVSWGRNPTDPYTGVVLTTSNQPIINHKLKERIDRYALLNNISVGRIIGRKRKVEKGPDPDNAIKRPSTITSHDDNSQTSSSASSDRNLTTQPPANHESKAQIIDLTGEETDFTDNALSSRLSKVLAKTSNLRTVIVPIASSSQCVQCGCKVKTHVQTFYSLTCAHLICKTCLTSVIEKTVKCITCSRESLKADVSRYHSV